MMSVRFTVLGPVSVSAAGARVTGMAPRHRAVLAYLLLHARTPIGTDRLISAMWGASPPETARSQVHATVTVVRRVLREAGAERMLATRIGGYVILPEPRRLDLEAFNDHLAAAQSHGDPRRARDELRNGLALWRGPALADVSADYVAGARARLKGRRLEAVERLAELELSLGGHVDLIDELAEHVAANPLRERLCGHLVLALHRAGRQADALSTARAFRERLVAAQGPDPSRSFLALERSVLRDDPALELPSGERAAGEGPARPAA